MILRTVTQKDGPWTIFAACTAREDCQLLDFLNNLPKQYHGSVVNLVAMLNTISDGSLNPRLLPDDKCHQIDKNNKIWEFIAGDIRVTWFYTKGKIIICSEGLIKKSKKTPKKVIDKAVNLKKLYKQEYGEKSIKVLPFDYGDDNE
jgi:hypothetical protein